ncbi:hypothetical protein DFP72DRAFT_1076090 [Ephemerocybe angulata]|uniref:Uncharacterized protein n=1 Tax=Ephemerocybe angulata TaxID=980116 RepID=A0A8H6HGS0_9AGAR|nr:hypothetical protein DFP72DRAFT_1076090 [Tulosesus angulatus]
MSKAARADAIDMGTRQMTMKNIANRAPRNADRRMSFSITLPTQIMGKATIIKLATTDRLTLLIHIPNRHTSNSIEAKEIHGIEGILKHLGPATTKGLMSRRRIGRRQLRKWRYLRPRGHHGRLKEITKALKVIMTGKTTLRDRTLNKPEESALNRQADEGMMQADQELIRIQNIASLAQM